eukprot:12826013-Ditylum_brightwellii.AAC.1
MPQFLILCNPITPTPFINLEIHMQPLPLRSEVFPPELYHLTYFHLRNHNTLILEYRYIDNKVPLEKAILMRAHFKNI